MPRRDEASHLVRAKEPENWEGYTPLREDGEFPISGSRGVLGVVFFFLGGGVFFCTFLGGFLVFGSFWGFGVLGFWGFGL